MGVKSKAYTKVLNEVSKEMGLGWMLCLQECEYHYEDGHIEYGFRFMWRNPDGRLIAHRGQARIPSLETAQELIQKVIEAGWGKNYTNN